MDLLSLGAMKDAEPWEQTTQRIASRPMMEKLTAADSTNLKYPLISKVTLKSPIEQFRLHHKMLNTYISLQIEKTNHSPQTTHKMFQNASHQIVPNNVLSVCENDSPISAP
jgi:hypothetical protein